MKKMLLVDDDPIVQHAFGQLFGAEWDIVSATDGEQAWGLLLAGLRPQVCCCDIVMPKLDGLELLRRTRAHPVLRHLPFVLITAAPDARTVQAAADAGANGFIVKPFLRVQAPSAIQAALVQDRDSRSEHFLVTRRRLQIGLDALEGRLRELLAQAQRLAHQEPGEARTREWHLFAHACRELGLWRGADLALDLADRPLPEGDARMVMQEICALVEDQASQLAALG
jgi:two-component system chemotaxis response regulator CheY